jgi:hypothetical protein
MNIHIYTYIYIDDIEWLISFCCESLLTLQRRFPTCFIAFHFSHTFIYATNILILFLSLRKTVAILKKQWKCFAFTCSNITALFLLIAIMSMRIHGVIICIYMCVLHNKPFCMQHQTGLSTRHKKKKERSLTTERNSIKSSRPVGYVQMTFSE